MEDKKAEALKKFFLKKNENQNSACDEVLYYVDVNMESDDPFSREYGLGIDEFSYEDVSDLSKEEALLVREKELVNIFDLGLRHSNDFSRRDWLFYVIRAAKVVSNFCCSCFDIDPETVFVEYHGNAKGYTVVNLNQKKEKEADLSKNQDDKTTNENEFADVESANQNEELGNNCLDVDDLGSQSFNEAANTTCFLDAEGLKFCISINITYPMEILMGQVPDVFCTFFHEMWHVKEFYEEFKGLIGDADNIIIREYDAPEVNLEETNDTMDESKMNFVQRLISRYKRCSAYSVDYNTWSSNPSEIKADLFGTKMTKLFLDELNVDKRIKKLFLSDRKQVARDHEFNSWYVPIRSAVKALLNIGVPEILKDHEYFSNELNKDEIVSLLSIEKAKELNPELLGKEGYEKADYTDKFTSIKSFILNNREIFMKFLGKNFEAINKIMELNEECLNVEYMLEDLEESKEDMEAGMCLLN